MPCRLSILLLAIISMACPGPQGPQGPQGAEGPTGPQGPPGVFTGAFAGDVALNGNVTVGGDLTVNGGVVASIFPVGMVVAFAGDAAPPGWLLCDGAPISRTQYSALFSVIGVKHGAGDLVSTFNVPDYRGRFLRGVDHGQGRDPDRATRTAMNTGGATGDEVGSVQQASLASHFHNVGVASSDQLGSNPALNLNNQGIPIAQIAPTTSRSTTSAGGAETRPVNANVNFIIKY